MADFVNHYSVLGLAKNATPEEIKKAFAALAKDLHPDLNPGQSAVARFQQVKEAYDVLRDPIQKSAFDKQLQMNASTAYDPEELRRRAEAFRQYKQPGQAGAGPTGQARIARLLESMLRPRTLFLAAPLLGWFVWSATDKLSPKYNYAEYGDKVQAWYNPKTARWETPAPWDPMYQANKRNTKMVPRKEVHLSIAPTVGTLGSAIPPAVVATAVAQGGQEQGDKEVHGLAARTATDIAAVTANVPAADQPPENMTAAAPPVKTRDIRASEGTPTPPPPPPPFAAPPSVVSAAASGPPSVPSLPPARKLPPAIISMEEGVIRTNRGFILK